MPRSKKTETKQSVRAKPVRSRRSPTNLVAASVQRLLFGVAAFLMVFRPMSILTALMYVIGVALVLFGLYRTVAGFVVSRDAGGGWFDVLFGLINVVLGVLFCMFPAGSVISMVYIFVVLFLFKSLRALVFSINMIRAKFGHYWMDLIISIILIALAVILLFYPMAGALVMVYYLAVALLLYAAADVYMYIEILRLKRLTAD